MKLENLLTGGSNVFVFIMKARFGRNFSLLINFSSWRFNVCLFVFPFVFPVCFDPFKVRKMWTKISLF